MPLYEVPEWNSGVPPIDCRERRAAEGCEESSEAAAEGFV